MVGRRGPQGLPGKMGAQGYQGQTGAQGSCCSIQSSINMSIFSNSTIYVPPSTVMIIATLWGAGGGGINAVNPTYGSGGGGSGSAIVNFSFLPRAGPIIISVGTGGIGGDHQAMVV